MSHLTVCSSSSSSSQVPVEVAPLSTHEDSIAALKKLADALCDTCDDNAPGNFFTFQQPLFSLFRLRFDEHFIRRADFNQTFFPTIAVHFTRSDSLVLRSIFSVFVKSTPDTRRMNEESVRLNAIKYDFLNQDKGKNSSNKSGSEKSCDEINRDFFIYCSFELFAYSLKTNDFKPLAELIDFITQTFDDDRMQLIDIPLKQMVGPFSRLDSLERAAQKAVSMFSRFAQQGKPRRLEGDALDRLPVRHPITKGSIPYKELRERMTTHDIFPLYETAILALQCNDIAALRKTPLDLDVKGKNGEPILSVHRYRAAVRSFLELSRDLGSLNTFHSVSEEVIASRLKMKLDSKLFLTSQQKPFEQIVSKAAIPMSVKVILRAVVTRRLTRLYQNEMHLELLKHKFLSFSTLEYYGKVMMSPEAGIIAGTSVNSGPTYPECLQFPPFDVSAASTPYPNFAVEHRQVYEDIIPRFDEVLDYLSTTSSQMKRDLTAIREIPLFLTFGLTQELIEKLNDMGGNVEGIDSLIDREISQFCINKKTPEMRDQIKHYLKRNKTLNDRERATHFKYLEDKWTHFPEVVELMIRPLVETARKDLPYLFMNDQVDSSFQEHGDVSSPLGVDKLLEAPRQSPAQLFSSEELARLQTYSPSSLSDLTSSSHITTSRSHAKGRVSSGEKRAARAARKKASLGVGRSTPVTSASSSSSSSSSEAIPSTYSQASSSQPISEEPSLISLLQNCRSHLQTWQKGLSSGRHELTAHALANAAGHFNHLLCSFRRFQQHAEKGSVTPQEVFAFVNHCIQHCTLGVEQTLSALERDSNGITDPKQLHDLLTHNLFVVLQRCNMGNGDLSPGVRRWIREINHGEILMRNFNLLTSDQTLVQSLLRTNQAFLEGVDGVSSTDVFTALDSYLAPLGEFIDAIQYRFAPGSFVPLEMEENISELCASFCDSLAETAVIPATSTDSSLTNLHRAVESLQVAPSELSNLRNNLMTRLAVEVETHAHLEPIEAALHLSNVLLLNQSIAEEVLIHALNVRGLPLSFEEETQHDLMSHIEKLGIQSRFSAEELEFLKYGKASRQLVRYPASRPDKPTSAPATQSQGRGRGRGRGKVPVRQAASSSGPSALRLDHMHAMLSWGRTLSDAQIASTDLRGFRSANPEQAKKLDEIREFALNDVRLLTSIVGKVAEICRRT